jgi:hypothetical protein
MSAKSVGDKVTYQSAKSGKKKRTGKIVKIEKKNGDIRYELDNGAFVYDSDLTEETGTSAVAMPDGPLQNKMPCGTPYFDCDEDDFFSLHLKAKRNPGQWYKKYYGQDVGDWAKNNKGKSFYLKHNEMFRKIRNR